MYYKSIRLINRYIDKFRFKLYLAALRQFGINIVYNAESNKFLSKKYFNVLYISESPEYAKRMGWFRRDQEYDLEVSYRYSSLAGKVIEPGPIYSLVDVFCNKNAEKNFEKNKNFVMILSEKKFLSGHILRHEIYNKYKNDLMFEFYGRGASNSIGDVCDVYNASKYTIIIENFKDENYTSEKIYDAIWSGSIPIYYGAKVKLEKEGFDMAGIICIENLSDVDSVVSDIKKNINGFYNKRLRSIEFNKNLLKQIRSDVTESFIKNIVICQFIRSSKQYRTQSGDWGRYFLDDK